jgi:hypothetical protein
MVSPYQPPGGNIGLGALLSASLGSFWVYLLDGLELEGPDLRPRNKMAKKRRTRFSLKEDRQLIQMAATSATLEEALRFFGLR